MSEEIPECSVCDNVEKCPSAVHFLSPRCYMICGLTYPRKPSPLKKMEDEIKRGNQNE